MPLTAKQQQFVEQYLIDLNATQAAIRAGYSKDWARQIAAENMSKPVIVDAIAEAKAKRSAETGVDSAWVLKRLALEAEADLADLYDENGNLKAVSEWPLIWRQGIVAGVETVREVGSDGEEISSVDKVRLSDRIKRIELIGKHVGVQAFKDRIEHDVTDGLAEALRKARERAIANTG